MIYLYGCKGVARCGELRRISLPRTQVNEECEELACIPLDDQGEAVAEAEFVAEVTGTVLSGAGTVFWTVPVRACDVGGAASSPLLPIRPSKNPKSSATANTTGTSTTNLASPAFLLLLRLTLLLLPVLLSLHSFTPVSRFAETNQRVRVRSLRDRPGGPVPYERSRCAEHRGGCTRGDVATVHPAHSGTPPCHRSRPHA
jgi:hypothetical protein